MRPLEGLLVLDFSTLLPGPMASLLLAEAGAEVVKVERPGRGDEMRTYEPKAGDDSINFVMLNRGKKSITLDLKQESDRKRLDPLLRRADIVIEQYRPGVMARLGLDYDSVARINPKIIYCSITGYGQSGPKRDVAAHDLNYIGDAGLLGLSMGPPAAPVVPPALIADIAGGAYPAVMNILLALQERQRSGKGRYLDIAMADNIFVFMYWALGEGFALDEWPDNGASLVTGGTPRYRLYGTRDGRMVAAAPIEQKFWDTFCEIIGLDEVLRDDSANPSATTARIAEIIGSMPADVWASRFDGKDCCCSVVATLKEAVQHPQFAARGLFSRKVAGEGGQPMPALPVPIDPAFRGDENLRTAPGLGNHNDSMT